MNLPKMFEEQKAFAVRLDIPVSTRDLIVAINVEISECINATQTWKWWKKNKAVDKYRVLDELADVYAFWLSFLVETELHGTQSVDYKEIRRHEIFALVINKTKNLLKREEPVHVHELRYLNNITTTDVARNSTAQIALLTAYVMQLTGCSPLEIEEAYFQKMQTNHKRQDENY